MGKNNEKERKKGEYVADLTPKILVDKIKRVLSAPSGEEKLIQNNLHSQKVALGYQI